MTSDTKPRNARNMNRANVRDALTVARLCWRKIASVLTDNNRPFGITAENASAPELAAWRREIEAAARADERRTVVGEIVLWVLVEEIALNARGWEPMGWADEISDRFGGGE